MLHQGGLVAPLLLQQLLLQHISAGHCRQIPVDAHLAHASGVCLLQVLREQDCCQKGMLLMAYLQDGVEAQGNAH